MVAIIGEALVDLVSQPADGTYVAHPGGSPYNVAIGVARLGHPSVLMARMASDAFGRQLREQAADNGVDLTHVVDAPELSTLAVVGLSASGDAEYTFYRNGTADWQWTDYELDRLPAGTDWVHTGSLASWLAPGCLRIAAKLARMRTQTPTTAFSYDPNIRPALMPPRAEAVHLVESYVTASDVVKASAEDLAWLYPGTDPDAILERWLALGPSLVALTDGGNGSRAVSAAGTVAVAAAEVEVVDTVGAGDSFMAGLIHAILLTGRRPQELDAGQVADAVSTAARAAAITCGRAGANPPTAAELDQR